MKAIDSKDDEMINIKQSINSEQTNLRKKCEFWNVFCQLSNSMLKGIWACDISTEGERMHRLPFGREIMSATICKQNSTERPKDSKKNSTKLSKTNEIK